MSTVSESIPLTSVQLEAVLTANILAGEPVCVSGPPGGGKTMIANKAMDNAIKVWGCGGKEVNHPTTSEPTDIKGLPCMTERGAEFQPYGLLRRMRDAKEPYCVFLDDFGHAPQSVQASWMQAINEGQVNDTKISDAVRFICATNRKVDRGSGVNNMIEPLKKKMLMLEYFPDLTEWRLWAASNGINPKVIAYLSLQKDHFIGESEPNSYAVGPCPRGWHRLSRQMALQHSPDVLPAVFAGCVGKVAGAGFAGFLRVYENLVMPATVWAGPTTAPVPSDPSALWALVVALANEVKNNTIGAYLTYMERLMGDHREHVMLSLHVMATRDPSLQATAAYIKAAQGPLGRLMLGGK